MVELIKKGHPSPISPKPLKKECKTLNVAFGLLRKVAQATFRLCRAFGQRTRGPFRKVRAKKEQVVETTCGSHEKTSKDNLCM